MGEVEAFVRKREQKGADESDKKGSETQILIPESSFSPILRPHSHFRPKVRLSCCLKILNWKNARFIKLYNTH